MPSPWTEIGKPLDPARLNMRRVSEAFVFDFYWARDFSGHSLLVLRHSATSAPAGKLPQLRGVEIIRQRNSDDAKSGLVIRLLDATLEEIFLQLCRDILRCVEGAASESEAVARTVTRTWRWHHLLRGGAGLLSHEDQMGLIGELIVLEQYLLPSLDPARAVAAWCGPNGAAQDFKLAGVLVESKARVSSGANEVAISSEHQLNASSDDMYLHLSVLDTTTDEGPEGFTVTDIAARVRGGLAGVPDALERFDALLAAAGFDFADDYSTQRWVGGERAVYHVIESFPRLIPSGLPPGIRNLRYWLDLSMCGDFLVSPSTLSKAISNISHA